MDVGSVAVPRLWRSSAIALLLLSAWCGAAAGQGLPPCSECGARPNEPCVLVYGATGVVRDKATGEPIAGATVAVLSLEGMTAEDGSFHLETSSETRCYPDYLYSFSARAPGYEPYSFSFYATFTFPQLTVELERQSEGASPTPTVCPARTPCAYGEHPRPCADQPCELGCGCEPCPTCGEGEVLSTSANSCECVVEGTQQTPTPTPTPSPPALPTASSCPGDCDSDGAVGISELLGAVAVALGDDAGDGCASFDQDRDGAVAVSELIAMVDAALDGCR
jgi:hypothetical protein